MTTDTERAQVGEGTAGVSACLPQLDAATVKAGEPEDVRAWLDSRRTTGVAIPLEGEPK